MENTFYGCTSLTTAPVIPSSVTNLKSTFRNCTSLKGNVEINTNNVSSMYVFFSFHNVDFEAQHLTLTGKSMYLDTMGAEGKNYCSTCNGYCKGGH